MAMKVAVDAFKFRQKCVNILHVIKRQCLPKAFKRILPCIALNFYTVQRFVA